mmetsp:Transcript_96516/g.277187  ORF Transcript_96516/g.277187 Transcript_96516/m.277187 type:complete len:427 (-) Transcript_96516:51-1331(-)
MDVMNMFSKCCGNPSTDQYEDAIQSGGGSVTSKQPMLGELELDSLDNLRQAAAGAFAVAATSSAAAAAPSAAEAGPSAAAAAGADAEEVARDFVLEVHSATLNRSFAKFGWMDPYAIISCDSVEVSRTNPAKSAHKSPTWDMKHQFNSGKLPPFVMIEVYDKNNFHRDVFCGTVTVPLSSDMGSLELRDFTLTKKGRSTGSVRLSLKVLDPRTGLPAAQEAEEPKARTNTLGAEFDQVVTWASGKQDGNVQLTLQEQGPSSPSAGKIQEEEEPEEQPEIDQPTTNDGGKAALLMGSWKCVDTYGLEEFLKASGVGIFQRKIAMAAKWPGWDFSNEGDFILFINHSAIGDLKEEIPLNKEYAYKDGHKNDYTCLAQWIPSVDGGCLKIDRKGKIGDYVEERTIKGARLDFALTHSNGVKWGRSFERA